MTNESSTAKRTVPTTSTTRPAGNPCPGGSRVVPDAATELRGVLGVTERTAREVQLVVNKAAMKSQHVQGDALTVAIVAPPGAAVRHLANQIARMVELAAGGTRFIAPSIVPTLYGFSDGVGTSSIGPWLVQHAPAHEGMFDHQLCDARSKVSGKHGAAQLLMIHFPDDKSLSEFVTEMPAFSQWLRHVVHLGAGTPAGISAQIVDDLGFRSIVVGDDVERELTALIPHIEAVVTTRSADLANELADQLDVLATDNQVHPAHISQLGELYDVQVSSTVAADALAAMSGLESAKQVINDMLALAELPTMRVQGLHSIFVGPPGTGKSTVAAFMAQLLHEKGLISRPVVSQVTRSDLIGVYLGQTGPKVRRACELARGGVLFIDEAYSLVLADDDQYGHEAIAELIQFMEANRDDIVVVLAGYGPAMAELLSRNEGLASRFPFVVPFTPLAPEQLTELLVRQLAQEGLQLSPLARWAIDDFHGVAHCDPGYGSARGVRTLAQQLASSFLSRTGGDRTQFIDIPDIPVRIYIKETTTHE